MLVDSEYFLLFVSDPTEETALQTLWAFGKFNQAALALTIISGILLADGQETIAFPRDQHVGRTILQWN